MAALELAVGGALGPLVHTGALKVAKAQADFAKLQAAIGHIFADAGLLDQALTHVSAVKGGNVRLQSYQRLEFLGDSVLGLVVADLLLMAFPTAEEGELSRRKAVLVRKETCAEVATAWDVSPNIRLGAGEAQSGARRQPTVLADVCEALIGAVYLDAGYEAAKTVVEKAWGARLTQLAGDGRDAKTLLQELALSRRLGTPVYREVSRSGPAHRLVFVVSAEVDVLGNALGQGRSKQEAEKAAARALLDKVAGEGRAA